MTLQKVTRSYAIFIVLWYCFCVCIRLGDIRRYERKYSHSYLVKPNTDFFGDDKRMNERQQTKYETVKKNKVSSQFHSNKFVPNHYEVQNFALCLPRFGEIGVIGTEE